MTASPAQRGILAVLTYAALALALDASPVPQPKLALGLIVAVVRGTPSGPGRIRTCGLGIKSPLLYQLSYRPLGRV
jgi:hypothetical protein